MRADAVFWVADRDVEVAVARHHPRVDFPACCRLRLDLRVADEGDLEALEVQLAGEGVDFTDGDVERDVVVAEEDGWFGETCIDEYGCQFAVRGCCSNHIRKVFVIWRDVRRFDNSLQVELVLVLDAGQAWHRIPCLLNGAEVEVVSLKHAVSASQSSSEESWLTVCRLSLKRSGRTAVALMLYAISTSSDACMKDGGSPLSLWVVDARVG